jgi:hypothetical protein
MKNKGRWPTRHGVWQAEKFSAFLLLRFAARS